MAKRDRSTGRTWLDGPTIPAPYDDTPAKWPGEKLGLPQTGPGALASVARRAGGVAIDWVICWIVAGFLHMFTTYLGDTATLTLMLFVLLGIISVTLFARTSPPPWSTPTGAACTTVPPAPRSSSGDRRL